MNMSNATIARFFFRLANLIEISGESHFKLQAYRRVAETLVDWPDSLSDLVAEGADLTTIPGVGTAIAEKIRCLVETGTFPLFERVRDDVPEGLLELLSVRGLGPARVRTLHRDLGIGGIEGLQEALEDGRLRQAKGFTARTEDRIRRSLYEYLDHRGRVLRVHVERQAESIVAFLAQLPFVGQVEVAGAYRRGDETVGRLQVVVATDEPDRLAAALEDWEFFFGRLDDPAAPLACTGDHDMPVELHPVTAASFGSTLLTLTGGPDFLELVGPVQDCAAEEDALQTVGLPWVPPELRHSDVLVTELVGRGMPELVVRDRIRGDLHMHTTNSDGRNSPTEMAQAARSLGYDYIAITDHTRNVKIAGGLEPEEIPEYFASIDAADRDVEGIRVLKGLEVDILADGTMDMPDEVMAQLDVVIAAVHSHFDQDVETMTARVLRAIEHPLVQFVAHPSGRLVGSRSPLLLDFHRVFEAAQRTGTMLELNANPERLDLHAQHCAIARKRTIPVVINTDAHAVWQLENMPRGVLQARRGGLTADQVLNSRPLDALRERLLQKRNVS